MSSKQLQISGKIVTCVPPSKANNVALLDKDGYLADSGKALTPAAIGASASGHTHSATDITSGILPITRGGTGGTTAATALSNFGLTASAAELNYCDGVTGNIQAQLDSKFQKDKIIISTSTSSLPSVVDGAILIAYDA